MAMTMLDSSRARSVLSKKLNIGIEDISKMIIWGNHSPTMYPDFENIMVDGSPGKDLINDMSWVENEFLPVVQQRGKAVIDSRGASSATSAAKAALDTVMACERPTLSGDCFSAAVISDGSYDLPEGIICGMPLMTTPDGKVEIVRDITLSDLAKEKIKISTDELIEERSAVEDLLT
jgi:malate dehydrogenase